MIQPVINVYKCEAEAMNKTNMVYPQEGFN